MEEKQAKLRAKELEKAEKEKRLQKLKSQVKPVQEDEIIPLLNGYFFQTSKATTLKACVAQCAWFMQPLPIISRHCHFHVLFNTTIKIQ